MQAAPEVVELCLHVIVHKASSVTLNPTSLAEHAASRLFRWMPLESNLPVLLAVCNHWYP